MSRAVNAHANSRSIVDRYALGWVRASRDRKEEAGERRKKKEERERDVYAVSIFIAILSRVVKHEGCTTALSKSTTVDGSATCKIALSSRTHSEGVSLEDFQKRKKERYRASERSLARSLALADKIPRWRGRISKGKAKP